MKILLVGSGGREHAIAQKLSESRHRPELFFAPGNPGLRELGQRLDIDATDIQGLLLFAQREQIDLTVVGPEVPLSMGIADAFKAAGLALFGPVQAGARLESSKAFAKEIMETHDIPTAGYRFCPDEASALAALEAFQPPYVIKEDGLAAGKGVIIAADRPEAETAIHRAFAKAMPVVIEEFMQGQELSLLALCDGKRALPLIAAQDFKKVGEGNTGPNTGGMGAYAPVPLATAALVEEARRTVLQPMLDALQSRGIDYRGILYAGLMVGPDGHIRVVEFNVRFGDPETQVILPLLADDLADLMLAATQGDLSAFADAGIRFAPNRYAVTVALVSAGYPGDYQPGKPIFFPQYLSNDVHIFHAGTKVLPDQTKVTAGGRVLNVTALGDSLEAARKAAYEVVSQVKFEGMTYRRDIALHPAGVEALR